MRWPSVKFEISAADFLVDPQPFQIVIYIQKLEKKPLNLLVTKRKKTYRELFSL
jgi:hypothetical protein